jgi:hypothetical protein
VPNAVPPKKGRWPSKLLIPCCTYSLRWCNWPSALYSNEWSGREVEIARLHDIRRQTAQYIPMAICTANAVKRSVTAAWLSEARWMSDWTIRAPRKK